MATVSLTHLVVRGVDAIEGGVVSTGDSSLSPHTAESAFIGSAAV